MATVKEIIELAESKMHKTTDVLRVDLASVRAGRATPALLEKVMVDYYGTPTPVNQVASVTVPEPRMIIIQPWEKNLLKDIERAIMKSDLGLNPNSDGAVIRLNLPQLTEERRKEIVKTVHKKSEDARVIVRNLRRDANDAVKKAEKAKEITEDEAKKGTDDIQKMTDKIIKEIDNIMANHNILGGRHLAVYRREAAGRAVIVHIEIMQTDDPLISHNLFINFIDKFLRGSKA